MADHYIDFSAANHGDGTTPAQAASGGAAGAFNSLLSVVYVAGDSYWIRRNGTFTMSAGFNMATSVLFIGWPVSGDTYYSTRPAAGTSQGWDSDVQTYAQITSATSSLGVSVFYVTATGTNILERIKVSYTGSVQSNSLAIFEAQRGVSVNNCFFTNNYAGANQAFGIWVSTNTGSVIKIQNTTVEFTGAISGSNPALTLNIAVSTSDVECINSIFQFTGNPTSTATKCYQGASSVTVSFADCTFIRTVGGGSGPATSMVDFSTATHTSVAMYNCTLTDSATGSSANIMATGTSTRLIAEMLAASSGRRVSIGGAGHYVHFITFTQTVASSDYAIQMVAGAIFVCNNFTEKSGNTSGAINGTVASDILVQNTNYLSGSPYGSNPIAEVWEADSGQTVGAWKFTGKNGTYAAHAVNRSGGESYSVKVSPTAGSQNFLHGIAPMLPGLETIFAAVTALSTKVTIYGAYKGYTTPPDVTQIWACCDFFDQGSGARRAMRSSRGLPGVALTSDASTWNGDSVTPFKLEITIAPGQSCLAPIRVHNNHRTNGAYWYFDPKPVVT